MKAISRRTSATTISGRILSLAGRGVIGEQGKRVGEKPALSAVEIVDPDTLDPIDEIAIGQSFRVRLTFAEDPATEITETVTVRTSDGSALEILVTGNAQVIVSEPVLVAPSGQ
ncbi:MAG: hypothetical protein V3S87_10525 [Alphaproteobacteria bacterium]